MTFNSMEELKNYILSCSKEAIEMAQIRVFDIIDKFLERFYSEYTPVLYERTRQLLHSLVTTDIKSTGNGWVAEVYFDASLMDHSIKGLQGIGMWYNKGWSEEKILETAMIGEHPHGGWPTTNETQIWTESMKVLNKDAINILKQELINAGIPVR